MIYFSIEWLYYITKIIASIILGIALAKTGMHISCYNYVVEWHADYLFSNFKKNWELKNKCYLIIIADSIMGFDPEKPKSNYPFYSLQESHSIAQLIRNLDYIDESQKIDIILHTTGGNNIETKLLIDALLRRSATIRVFIPFRAYSAGTLVALTANEIYMGQNAHLGPIESQMVCWKKEDYISSTIISNIGSNIGSYIESNLGLGGGDQCQNNLFSRIVIEDAKRLHEEDKRVLSRISKKLYPTAPISKKISDGFLTINLPHNYPISVEEAREFGLTISTVMPSEIQKLYDFLPL